MFVLNLKIKKVIFLIIVFHLLQVNILKTALIYQTFINLHSKLMKIDVIV